MAITDKRIKVGSKVQLFPRDTHKKVCRIVEIDKYGYTFEVLEGTQKESGHAVGDILYYNHSNNIVLKLISNQDTF